MSDKQLPKDTATRTTPTAKAGASGTPQSKGAAQPNGTAQPKGSSPKLAAAKTGATRPKTAAATSQRAAAKSPAAAVQSAAAVMTKAAGPAANVPLIDLGEEVEQSWLTRTMLLFGGAAFSTSMIVHIILLLILGLVVSRTEIQQMLNPLTASVETPPEMLNQELDQKLTASTELSLTSSSPANIVSGQATGGAAGVNEPSFDTRVAENAQGPAVKVGDVAVLTRRGSSLTVATPEGTLGEPAAVVDSYADAMDRITQEILLQLSKNKVLLVWCFDQSESMKDDQQEIRDRIEKVYKELGLSSASQGDALLTAVASFGKETMIHTQKATSDLARIREAINAVPVDETGEEMMCTAVGTAIEYFRKYATSGQRQMMFVLVSDESGNMQDNFEHLEAAIATAKAARCICYALGRESVFGYPFAYMRWIDPVTKIGFWLRIDRGPETPMPEQLQTDGFTHRYDAHPSGFGPYEQVRIAQQTGGIFFMLPSLESNLVRGEKRKYELEMMRPYLPDLSARQDYINERDKHPDRAKIWEVIADLNPWDKARGKDVVVQLHFPIDPPVFAQHVARNLVSAERLVRYLQHNEEELAKIKKLRDREASPRWRANYDLIYAQTIAYRVRLYEYGYYLTEFMKNPKPITNPLGPNKKTNHWDIRTRAKLLQPDKHKADIDLATQLLKEVMKDHPGTPYAARAEWELKRGFGVELIEDYDDPRGVNVKRPNL
jgi:hypothetical protein